MPETITMHDALLTAGGLSGAIVAIIAIFRYAASGLRSGIGVNKNEKRIATLEADQEKMKKRIKDDQEQFAKCIKEMQEENRIANRAIVRAMVAIIDSTLIDNTLTSKSRENLENTKDSLMDFLEEN